jgi:hypothetical protein
MGIKASKEEEVRDTFQPSCNFVPGQDVRQWLVKQLQRWSVAMSEPTVSAGQGKRGIIGSEPGLEQPERYNT